MTQEIKFNDERQEALFRNIKPGDNPYCVIAGCVHPGATLTEFCPYHKYLFDFQVEVFKKDFIKKYSEGRDERS